MNVKYDMWIVNCTLASLFLLVPIDDILFLGFVHDSWKYNSVVMIIITSSMYICTLFLIVLLFNGISYSLKPPLLDRPKSSTIHYVNSITLSSINGRICFNIISHTLKILENKMTHMMSFSFKYLCFSYTSIYTFENV